MAGASPYRSWGLPLPPGAQTAYRLRWRDERLPRGDALRLPFGNGRSYGDSCLSVDGTLVDMRGLDRLIAFDPDRGILRCEAGVLLADVLDYAVPRGWFLPVMPGTRFVTVGGAIANDVHGKNHHHAGSFGHHVRAFELRRSDGSTICCSPQENADWFEASIGGLGLTGAILWAEIQLRRVASPVIETETLRFNDLEEFFALSRNSHRDHEYVVAWVDCLDARPGKARGLFFRGNHAPADAPPAAGPRRLPGIPFTPPFALMSPGVARLFNKAVYHRPRRPQSRTHYEKFFFPLDAVPNWNRIYGPSGFFQYQCVVPFDGAMDAIGELLTRIRRAGQGSVLSVLKVFGDRPPPGWMSFARPGVTLALDFPDRGAATRKLLDALDETTLAAGGAVYPAKDARMSPAVFRSGYPRWRDLESYRDPALMSKFWHRVTGGGA